MTTTTDSEIIARSIEHAPAFGELFDRHARQLGRYLARRVGPASAEDLLSETFLVAFRRRSSFDTSWESAGPWLFGIASNLVRKQRGTEARRFRALDAWAGLGRVDADSLEDALAREDARTTIRALSPRIAALSQRDRDTLLLYAWGELSYEEVAIALDVPIGTVRSRLNRVRRRLTAASGTTAPDPRGVLDRRTE